MTFNKTTEVSTEYGKKVEVLENENRTEITRIFKVFTVHKSKPSKILNTCSMCQSSDCLKASLTKVP